MRAKYATHTPGSQRAATCVLRCKTSVHKYQTRATTYLFGIGEGEVKHSNGSLNKNCNGSSLTVSS